jgi:AcrR family transcriptional regulator
MFILPPSHSGLRHKTAKRPSGRSAAQSVPKGRPLSKSPVGSTGGGGRGSSRLPLPRGRHRLTRQEVAENQRQRLLAALAESVAIRGYAATSVEHVIDLAGISRATFYKQFDNRRDCLLAAYEAVFEDFLAGVAAACASELPWEERVGRAIGAAIEFAVRRPAEARLLALDTIAADAEAASRALAGAERLAAMLRTGRDDHPDAQQLPEVTERALVGAVASVIHWRLLNGESLVGLEPQLIQLVLTPYVGAVAAAGQAERAGPRPTSQPG